MEVGATAPGKIVLLGEYAVALGRPAIVAAMDRRLGCRIRLEPGPGRLRVGNGVNRCELPLHMDTVGDAPLEVRFVVAAARVGARFFDLKAVDLNIETWSEIDRAESKVGLGGSAAIVAATLAAVGAASGSHKGDPKTLAGLGVAAHRLAQGGGSGADVVAATLGGVQWIAGLDADQVPRSVGEAALGMPVETECLELPTDLTLDVVFSGQSVRTGPRIDRFVALARGEEAAGRPARGPVSAWSDAMEHATRALRQACQANSASRALAAMRQGREVFGDLGPLIGFEMWSDGLILACQDEEGWATKPSGAGGGDCAVSLLSRNDLVARRDAWRTRGLQPLESRAIVEGVRVDAQS
jgi:phosphomevalonate kinase